MDVAGHDGDDRGRMPKNYGIKEKDQVVEHIIKLVLTGELRAGDRIDRSEIARELGLSRIPVAEAIVQLEHDGIVSTPYYRGAFVERFDRATLLEHHEVYGMLNGIAAARAAANPTPLILARLDEWLSGFRAAVDPCAFHEACWAYRDAINDEYAGPRLRAAIRASKNFVPNSFWTTYGNSHDDFLPSYEAEIAAIRARDPQAAQGTCVQRAELMAKIMLAALTERGVL